MTVFTTVAAVTLRGLLARRRLLLLVVLAALPALLALVAVGGGAGPTAALPGILELIVRTVLPLTALLLGVSAIGPELEDGTAVFVLAKPAPRWQVAAAKAVVAGVLTAALATASTLVTGVVLAGLAPTWLAGTVAYAVAIAVAAFAYAALFVALSVLTGRALFIGLTYTLVWEGVLAGILPGTRAFSIREATLGVAEVLAPPSVRVGGELGLAASLLLLAIVIVGGLAITTRRLAGYEVRGSD